MKTITNKIVRYFIIVLFFIAVIGTITGMVGMVVMKIRISQTFYVEGQLIPQEMYNLMWVWKGVFLGSLITGGITSYLWSERFW